MKTGKASFIVVSALFMTASMLGNVKAEGVSSDQPKTQVLTVDEAKELIQYTKLKQCVEMKEIMLDLIRRYVSPEELKQERNKDLRLCETETSYTEKQFNEFEISIAKTYGSNARANEVIRNSAALMDKLWRESQPKP